MVRYRHEQRSWWTAAIVVPVGGVLLGTAILADPFPLAARLGLTAGALVMAWLLVTFSRLTVEVTHQIVLFFGRGWPRKTIDPTNVIGQRKVRNRLWYGFGIRWIPGGSLWNVHGLDAVELALTTGKVFRIGTDDPDGLLVAMRPVAGHG